MNKEKILLLILDGFGISLGKEGNPIVLAKTPNLEKISNTYPGALLQASGMEVGLSWGEMGNSEVGHSNIGAGLVVYQNLLKIDIAIKDGSFDSIPTWDKLIAHSTKNNSPIHLIGMISNGGIHSHIDHLLRILSILKNKEFKNNIFIHFITDGQDTAPSSAIKFYEILKPYLSDKIQIASVLGRYYAMDKSENWDRTEKAYLCLTQGSKKTSKNIQTLLEASYSEGVLDERVEPTTIISEDGNPVGLIKDGDSIMFFNFRADRARQLTQAFIFEEFTHFKREKLSDLVFATMMSYGKEYATESLFPAQTIDHPLAEIVSSLGRSQFHIAETEKYAHVTYFFNGGTETQYTGEDRMIIPSPKVATYDLKPEMSAFEIAKETIKRIESNSYDLIVANLANGDMVGHTGNLKAGIKAIEIIDECIGMLSKAALTQGLTMLITADHGNIEEMINEETKEIDKEHSTNPVPLWLIKKGSELEETPVPLTQLAPQGILADIAPTILELMGIAQPKEMTGTSLLSTLGSCPLPK